MEREESLMNADYRKEDFQKQASILCDQLSSEDAEKVIGFVNQLKEEREQNKISDINKFIIEFVLPILNHFAKETESKIVSEISEGDIVSICISNSYGYTIYAKNRLLNFIIFLAQSVEISSQNDEISITLTFNPNEL